MGFTQQLFATRSELTGGRIAQILSAGNETYSGRSVTEEGSLRATGVFACVRIIAESLASLPLVLFRRSNRSRTRAMDHPLYSVLHDMANPEMTAFAWREFMISKTLLWGNAYSEIEYDRAGNVVGLWPLLPERMEKIGRDENGARTYHYRLPNHELRAFPDYKIHHLHGLSYDGVIGYSPIRMAMHAIGLSLATEEFGSRYFANGANMSGVLTHPGRLSEEAQTRLIRRMELENAGLSNAHRIRILEEGMQWHALTIPPDQSQFLQTRKMQIAEIARIFQVPLHMLAELDRATFSNIEHQGLEFVIHTLRPWIVRHEQTLVRDLLKTSERGPYMPRYIVDGLLRGDIKTRYEAYGTAIQNGFMSRNEVRELEDRNPAPDLDQYLVPLNMVEAERHDHDQAEIRPEVRPATRPIAARAVADRQAIMRRQIRLYEDAARRVVRREVADIRRALPRYDGTGDFLEWLAEFYQRLVDVIPGYYRALMLSYAETMLAEVAGELGQDVGDLDDELAVWIERYLENYARVYAVGSERQLRALIREADDHRAAVEERLDGWEDTRPGKEALDQAFEAGNALAVYAYGAASVPVLRWSARGDSCPLCQRLDGTEIPMGGAFADQGDVVEAEGVDPLPIVRKIKHGPLHGGCDCIVTAG